MNVRTWGCAMLVGGLVYACSSDDDEPKNGDGTGGQSSTGGGTATGGSTGSGAGTASGGSTAGAGGGPQNTGGAAPTTGGAASTGGTPPADKPTTPPDPNAATIEIPDVACGSKLDGEAQTPYAIIGGRRVYIDYACNKPKGTKVTFILNLHGTMDQEAGKQYIRNYYQIFSYADSHDFIVATPKSVVSQWGNGDGGKDLPHIQAVIDWMYEYFAGFDIRGMWVAGHSWGSAYTLGFSCRPEIEDKIKGVILMSGGSGMPQCADRLSVIGTVGETDIVPGQPTQSATATAHGCDAQSETTVGNNKVSQWANCDAGWVHKNYFMNGKGHGFSPVDWPEKVMDDDIADAIKATRQ